MSCFATGSIDEASGSAPARACSVLSTRGVWRVVCTPGVFALHVLVACGVCLVLVLSAGLFREQSWALCDVSPRAMSTDPWKRPRRILEWPQVTTTNAASGISRKVYVV